jgi:hypothetical protein
MTFTARRGRPLKFTRPSRTITVTVPEDTLEALSGVDPDVGRAIVRLAMGVKAKGPHPGVELATFGSRAVIMVSPTRVLSRLPGVELVPLVDGRCLIALSEDLSEPQFELAVRDALAGDGLAAADLALLERLATVLQEARESRSLGLRRIMVLHAAAASSGPQSGKSKRRKKGTRR